MLMHYFDSLAMSDSCLRRIQHFFHHPLQLPHLLLKKTQPLRALLPGPVAPVRIRPDYGGRDKTEVGQ